MKTARFSPRIKRIALFAAVIFLTAGCGCTAGPAETAPADAGGMYGSYRFEKQIYMHPLSSYIAFDGLVEYYTLTEDSLFITDQYGNRQRIAVSWAQEEMDEQSFLDSFTMDMGAPDIGAYKTRYQYTLSDASGEPVYRVYVMDGAVWLARIRGDATVWSIYSIERYDGEIPLRFTVSGWPDGVDEFLSLQKDFKSGYETDVCYNITPNFIADGSDYAIFKYDASCASFLLYDGAVYPMGIWTGGWGVTSMDLADLNGDGEQELYFTYSFGSGMHRSHIAYFDPATLEIKALDYMHINGDMLICTDADDTLSVYDARIADMDGFANFSLEAQELLATVVFIDGRVQAVPVGEDET